MEGVAVQMVEFVRATSAGQRLQLAGQSSSVSDGDVVTGAKAQSGYFGISHAALVFRPPGKSPGASTGYLLGLRYGPCAAGYTFLYGDRSIDKNQLNDLYQRLKIILNQAQRTRRTGPKIFQGILSAAAQISRDPSANQPKTAAKLRGTGSAG